MKKQILTSLLFAVALTVYADSTPWWQMKTDGSQYPWVTEEYHWGTVHHADGLTVKKSVRSQDGDIIETYTLTNSCGTTMTYDGVEIFTPFNDNYPDAETCTTSRCHAHIWAAGEASYVCALRMGAKAPHVALMLTKGALDGYSIYERDSKKGSSNFRGVIALRLAPFTLKKGGRMTVEWRIFEHDGWNDFFHKMTERGGVYVRADKYVGNVGETLHYDVVTRKGTKHHSYTIDRTGDIRVPVADGKTYVELLGVSNEDSIISRRARFIMEKQVYHADSADAAGMRRNNAILPYDNATGQPYCNWLQERNWSDANEGRERIGTATFLALLAQRIAKGEYKTDDSGMAPRLQHFLKDYCHFVRTQLQDEDFRTWSDADKGGSRGGQKNRFYNFPWIAHLYCEMYDLTGDREYLRWAYGTMKKCYEMGGYKFYYIDVPVRQSIRQLRDAGMTAEADTLLAEYKRQADAYIAIGLNYPKSEVNYEQSIVAPSVDFLLQVYLATGEDRYLSAARDLLPVVEAFGGQQPSSHLNDISIRHWDGYWFGMPKQWGDTFPHYWSCITAECFANYAEATGDASYQRRAEKIVEENLNLFTEDGRGGAAYIYPVMVNGKAARGLNAFANDQDTALMYYLKLKQMKSEK